MKYNYKLVRSGRKTVCVCVTVNNEIIVRAPYLLSVSKIENFLQSKSGWIDKKVTANNKNLGRNSDVTRFESVPVGGVNVPLVLGKGNLGLVGGSFYVNSLEGLQKVMVNCFGDELISRFYDISRRTGLTARSVKFRSYKSRWGCCDSGGNITFNYKILMLPKDIQNYIIVHELCHTRQMNHSRDFWREVELCLPGYKAERARLKNYAYLTRLYA